MGAAQCGHRLANGTLGSFHRARLDRRPAGSHRAVSISVGKNLKQGYGIVKVLEEGVTTEFFAKGMPDVPSGVRSVSSGGMKRSLCNLFNKAEFVAESISEGTGASFQ